MAKYIIDDSLLTNVADTIRSRTGRTNKMSTPTMPSLINEISYGDGDSIYELFIEDSFDAYELPDELTMIGDYALYNSNIKLTELSSGITSIGEEAFHNCNRISSITFKGTPNFIASTAFNTDPNLKTINVPWSEGAVANAPWGATDATINYDYSV